MEPTTSQTTRAAEFLQIFPADILAAIIRNEINVERLAREELASRGLNLDLAWVGFKQARVLHMLVESTKEEEPK